MRSGGWAWRLAGAPVHTCGPVRGHTAVAKPIAGPADLLAGCCCRPTASTAAPLAAGASLTAGGNAVSDANIKGLGLPMANSDDLLREVRGMLLRRRRRRRWRRRRRQLLHQTLGLWLPTAVAGPVAQGMQGRHPRSPRAFADCAALAAAEASAGRHAHHT